MAPEATGEAPSRRPGPLLTRVSRRRLRHPPFRGPGSPRYPWSWRAPLIMLSTRCMGTGLELFASLVLRGLPTPRWGLFRSGGPSTFWVNRKGDRGWRPQHEAVVWLSSVAALTAVAQ